MQRRQVLQTSATALGATVGLAGCLSSSSDDQQTRRPEETERERDDRDSHAAETTPDDPETTDETETPADLTAPPRESAVFASVEVSEARLLVTFESSPVVESLADLDPATAGNGTTGGEATTAGSPMTATTTNGTATNETATATTGRETTIRPVTTADGADTTTASASSSRGGFDDVLAALFPVGVAAGRPGRGGRGGGGRGGRSGGGRNGGSGSGTGGSGWGGGGSGSGSGSGWGGSGTGGGKSSGSGGSKSGSGGSRSGSGGKRSGSGGSSDGGSGRPAPGKRGSGRSPSRGRNGRRKWRGGSYAAWRDRHAHEVREYDAAVAECGVGYLGGPDATDDDLPGAGPVEWARRCDGDHDEMAVEPSEPGWYRIGARLSAPEADHDFGWEAVDVRLLDGDDGWRVDSRWKVSPRL